MGDMFAIFHNKGTVWYFKEELKTGVITGAKSYAKSLHNQKGNSSGPELVHFRFNKNFCTGYSDMTGIGVPSGIET
jgi:hypothetical protein